VAAAVAGQEECPVDIPQYRAKWPYLRGVPNLFETQELNTHPIGREIPPVSVSRILPKVLNL